MLTVLLDLVLPRTCAGCGVPGPGLCGTCRSLLAGPALGLVRPTPCPPGLPPLAALGTYDGALQRLLLAHKERGSLQLTTPLGRGLAQAVRLHGAGPFVLCPVPSAPRAVRERGHDHALRLARAAARALGPAVTAERLLRPARSVADQSGLTSAERGANLRDALRATGVPRRRVIVVDDVVTTGATLVEATRALTAAGHEVVGAAALAATQRTWASPRRASPLPPVPEAGYRP